MALLCDAVIGNVQEKSMKTYGASNAEVVLYSYSIGFLYIFIVMLFTGDLFSGIAFFAQVSFGVLSESHFKNNSLFRIL